MLAARQAGVGGKRDTAAGGILVQGVV